MKNGDVLPCCGCVIHNGPEESDCICACHDTARLVYRIEPRGWKS